MSLWSKFSLINSRELIGMLQYIQLDLNHAYRTLIKEKTRRLELWLAGSLLALTSESSFEDIGTI